MTTSFFFVHTNGMTYLCAEVEAKFALNMSIFFRGGGRF